MKRWASPIITLSLLTSLASSAAEGEWALWSGSETIVGPMWERVKTLPTRSDCETASDHLATVWVSRMESEGRNPIRVGTDVSALTANGDSILTVHFVCLPDAKDPRVR